ncbi:general stress protein [Mycolicibacterium tusciae]|uniref:general stress protein n=1 Tax=Mycolicibacterium tusciae TaxID=75922 RepID=UPI00024A3EF8|nr:general stress protein [Mycolicibacterium tusciae]
MDSHSDQSFDDPASQADASAEYRVIASYRDYTQAQRAVDYLSDAEFPVENLRIIGHGVTTVEAVIGRMTKGRAALMGASSGAWWGLLIGLLLAMFAVGTAWFGVMVAGLLAGAVWGAIFGFAGHWATRGRRDFTSVSTLAAERYDIVCTPALTAKAATLLTTLHN